MSRIFSRIRAIVASALNVPDIQELTPTTDVYSDLGAGITDVTLIAVGIEEEFNIVLPEESEYEARTITDFVKLAEKHGATA